MTEEIPQKTKAELFAEDPDRFIDMNDVTICIVKDHEKKVFLPVMGNQNISGMDTYVIAGMVAEIMTGFRDQMRKQQADRGIVKPGSNGFMAGVRSLGRKR